MAQATCPNCGGKVTRLSNTSAAGERAWSPCCDIGLDILDNWETFAALPPNLREVALLKDRKQRAAVRQREIDNAAAFERRREQWLAAHKESLCR